MREHKPDEATLPLVEEQLAIEKRPVATGRVRIRTMVDEHLARVSEELEREDVTVERVAINQEVREAPGIREENGVLIVPVLEEVLVVEKRLMLKEELHVHRKRVREPVEHAGRVRRMRAEVERVNPQTSAEEARLQENGERTIRRTAPPGRKPPLESARARRTSKR